MLLCFAAALLLCGKAMPIKAMAIGKKGDESDIVSYAYSIRETDMQIALAKGWNWTSHNQADPLTAEQLVALDTRGGQLYDIAEQLDFLADAVGSVSVPWRMTLGKATGSAALHFQTERLTIYHINGTLITTDGNRRTIERLHSGVYVINGVKYVIE